MSGFNEEYERVLPHNERVRADLVVKSFVQGMSGPAIGEHLQQVHRIPVERDDPGQDILRAARKRWLRYEAPPDAMLFEALQKAYPGLNLGEPPLPAPAGEGRGGAIWRIEDGIMVHVPSFGERMTCVAAAARLCAERIRERAEEKVMGKVAAGEAGRGGDPVIRGLFPVPDKGSEPGGVQRELCDVLKQENAGWPGCWDEVEVLPLEVEIRIGFGAGYLLSMVADDLGHAIAANLENWERDLRALVLRSLGQAPGGSRLPRREILLRRFRVEVHFVLLNLVAGFDPESQSNPISFIAAMLRIDHLDKRCRQVVFNAMSFVPIEADEREPEKDEPEHRLIGEIPVLREVHEQWGSGLDIILATGSCISDEHSAFRRYYRGGKDDARGAQWLCDLLQQEGVRGDFLSLPVTDRECRGMGRLRRDLKDKGRIDADDALRHRPMTLLGPGKVAAHVAGGGDVVFVVGPCGVCDTDKSEITKAVMCQDPRLVTHLVIDRTTAQGLITSADEPGQERKEQEEQAAPPPAG